MHLSDLKTKHITELVELATTNQIDNANRMRKQDLMFALLKSHAKKGESIFGEGTLEVLPDLKTAVGLAPDHFYYAMLFGLPSFRYVRTVQRDDAARVHRIQIPG